MYPSYNPYYKFLTHSLLVPRLHAQNTQIYSSPSIINANVSAKTCTSFPFLYPYFQLWFSPFKLFPLFPVEVVRSIKLDQIPNDFLSVSFCPIPSSSPLPSHSLFTPLNIAQSYYTYLSEYKKKYWNNQQSHPHRQSSRSLHLNFEF